MTNPGLAELARACAERYPPRTPERRAIRRARRHTDARCGPPCAVHVRHADATALLRTLQRKAALP